MKRLTDSNKEIPTLDNNAEYWLQVYFRLKDYEDTGLTPEQIVEHDKEYARMCNEVRGYEELGYTPEELKLLLNPPKEIWLTGEREEGVVCRAFLDEEQQIALSNGDAYWQCRDEYGDYQSIPISGLGETYFLTQEEAESELIEHQEQTGRTDRFAKHIMNRFTEVK